MKIEFTIEAEIADELGKDIDLDNIVGRLIDIPTPYGVVTGKVAAAERVKVA